MTSLWMLTGNSLVAAEVPPYRGAHRRPTRRARARAAAARALLRLADFLSPPRPVAIAAAA